MFDFYEGFPVEGGWVLNNLDLRLRTTVEDNIKPVVLPKPLCRPVFICRESNLPDNRPAFHFDEPHLDCGLRVLRMWAP